MSGTGHRLGPNYKKNHPNLPKERIVQFEVVLQRLRWFENQEFGKGASSEDVSGAQRDLGVVFPNSYVVFLKECGWGGVEPIEIYGLGADVPDYLNVVKMTHSERTEAEPTMRLCLVPLLNDGFGNHYCLNTDQQKNGECPIVFWNHELDPDQQPEEVATSFAEWLSGELDELESEEQPT